MTHPLSHFAENKYDTIKAFVQFSGKTKSLIPECQVKDLNLKCQ